MRHGVLQVFDEVISGEVVGSTDFRTSPEVSSVLAVPDQMGIQVVVDNVTCAGTIPPMVSVAVETSGNGIHWVTKSSQPEVAPFSISTNETTVSPYGADAGSLPNMGFVCLRITFTVYAVPATAHVKVYGCGSSGASTISTICNKTVDKGGATRGTYEVQPTIREPKEAPSWKQPTTIPPRLPTFFRPRARYSIG